ncbi:MAG: hypothetical protein ABIA04_15420 [Pseudomonadota bacterium]
MTKKKALDITSVSKSIYAQISKTDWKIEIEDDYADFKNFAVTIKNPPHKAFNKLELLIMTLGNDPNNVEIRFIFYADPAKIGDNKRKFGKLFRENNYAVLRNLCENILKLASLQAGEAEIGYIPCSFNKIYFTKKEAVKAAYEVSLVYFIKS